MTLLILSSLSAFAATCVDSAQTTVNYGYNDATYGIGNVVDGNEFSYGLATDVYHTVEVHPVTGQFEDFTVKVYNPSSQSLTVQLNVNIGGSWQSVSYDQTVTSDGEYATFSDLYGSTIAFDYYEITIVGSHTLGDYGLYEAVGYLADCDGDTVNDVDNGGSDCDDDDALTYPGAIEIYYDGIDEACDGGSDYDADADGYDSDLYGGDDCNDSDATIAPLATDAYYDGIDSDCAGNDDYDADWDGYTSSAYGGDDCDDSASNVNPGIAEDPFYDGIDSNCDGANEFDADGDGYESAAYGYDDCDDTNAAVSPSAIETCNGIDDNCDGDTDEGSLLTWYADADGDGYGDVGSTTEACSAPTGYVSDSSDCDDTTSEISPAIAEVCDGIDNDCDGGIDVGMTLPWYADSDGDGFGDVGNMVEACSAPTGYIADKTDCDDTNPSAYPGAPDTWYDGIDSDCAGDSDYDQDVDGYDSDLYGGSDCDDTDTAINPGATDIPLNGTDEDCDGSDATAWEDADDDGESNETDCNDSDPAINSDATEVACDGIDQNCDGTDLESDVDGDGYSSCEDSDEQDCDDGNSDINPGAAESCNGIDDNCEGSVDEGFEADTNANGVWDCYETDNDGDGYTVEGGDCNDSNDLINPDATETYYDGIDQNCDGSDDYDQDGDGFQRSENGGTDCNDSDATINPDMEDITEDGVDQDCDGFDGIPDEVDTGDGIDEDTGTVNIKGVTGCGCSSTPTTSFGWIYGALIGLLALRRRA